MPTSALSFRIPEPLRKAATARSKATGIPLALVVKNALTEFAEGKKALELGYTPTEVRQILKAVKDADQGKGMSKAFTTKAQVKDYLHSLK